MIELMRISIVINTILPVLAIIQAGRALVLSKVLYSALLANKRKLEEEGLLFLIAENKMLLVFVSHLTIVLIGLANMILFTWSTSRINAGWAEYSTRWIEFTAVLFHFIMYLIPQLIFSILKQSKFTFFSKLINLLKT